MAQTKMTQQQWVEAFEKEGPFSWSRYYSGEGYAQFKALLKAQNASLQGDTRAKGRCIKCSARMSIDDVVVLVPNSNPRGRDTITLISNHRDHNC